MTRQPYNTGKQVQSGKLAVHRQDFTAHYEGGGFNHYADQILMQPNSTITVKDVLDGVGSNGANVISIGHLADPFNPHDNLGDYNVNSVEYPSLKACIEAALTNNRLENGGVIFIKSGIYFVGNAPGGTIDLGGSQIINVGTGTISVPKGISIVGENSGTIIDTVMDPNLPMWVFEFESSEVIDIGFNNVTQINSSFGLKENILLNLTICDNLNNVIKDPNNINDSMPSLSDLSGDGASFGFIYCSAGANLIIDNCKFIGKISMGDSPVRYSTKRVVTFSQYGTFSVPSLLEIRNCFIDGVSQVVLYDSAQGKIDKFNFINNKVRWLGHHSTMPNDYDSFAIIMNRCTSNINYNNFIGENNNSSLNASGVIYIKDTLPANNDGCTIARIGNNGGINLSNGASVNHNTKFLVLHPSLNDFRSSVISGIELNNSYGAKGNNDWFITIGDGINSFGDISGVYSLDVALKLAEQWSSSTGMDRAPYTVIVNYGTYRLTANEGSNIKRNINIIGNPSSFSNSSSLSSEFLPTIKVAWAHGTGVKSDALNQRYGWLGWNLKNLNFESDLIFPDAPLPQSIRFTIPNDNLDCDVSININNCNFKDISLVFDNFLDSESNSFNRKYIVYNIENCKFYQTAPSGEETISLYIPAVADVINIKNCIFSGYGYPLYILTQTGNNYSSFGPIVNIDECIFTMFGEKLGTTISNNYRLNLSGNNATALRPANSGWFRIILNSGGSQETGKVNISKSLFQGVYLDPTQGSVYASINPNINSGVVRISSFLNIKTRELNITETDILSPYQGYTSSSIKYQIHAINTTVGARLNIDKCNIQGTGCLYATGFYAQDGTSNNFGSGSSISLINSSFTSYEYISYPVHGLNNNSTTLIDLNTSSLYDEGLGAIIPINSTFNMTNCHVCNYNPPADGYRSYHIASTTDPNFTGYNGLVEVKLFKWQINLSNNTIQAFLPGSPTISHNASLICINELISDVNDPGFLTSNININNNKIYTYSSNLSSVGAKFLSLHTYGQTLHINNNMFQYHGTTSMPTSIKSFIQCGIKGTNSSYPDIGMGIITGNQFVPKPVTMMSCGVIFLTPGNIKVYDNSFSSWRGGYDLTIGPNGTEEDWFNTTYSLYEIDDNNNLENNKGTKNSILLPGHLSKMFDASGADYDPWLYGYSTSMIYYPEYIKYGASYDENIVLQNINKSLDLELSFIYNLKSILKSKIRPLSFSVDWTSTVNIPINMITMKLMAYNNGSYVEIPTSTGSLSGTNTSLTRTYTIPAFVNIGLYEYYYIRLLVDGNPGGSGTYNINISPITFTWVY